MSSIDDEEIKKFSELADEWWDKSGKFKPLHDINHVRVECIKKFLYDKNVKSILDIGCGGGILSESMAGCGYKVTAIDPSYKNIEVAKLHAKGLDINYQNTTLEDFVKSNQTFDVVLCMEVIEHVADVDSFVELVASVVRDGGFVFFSTINRTVASYLQAIIGAEYILRWLPRGTHQWKKFITPYELRKSLSTHEVKTLELHGMKYSAIHNDWELSNNTSVNYILIAGKPSVML